MINITHKGFALARLARASICTLTSLMLCLGFVPAEALAQDAEGGVAL